MTLQITQGRQVPKSISDFAAEHAFDLLVLGRQTDGLGPYFRQDSCWALLATWSPRPRVS